MHEDFSYQKTKDDKVLISWRHKSVVTLKGHKAQSFLRQADDADEEELQLLMTRVTGNFKRGNERHAKRKNE